MNLIWICSDTFRNDHLGCMGAPVVKTPCLDALAAEGVLFEEAHIEAFPTGPARLVYMTGKYVSPFRKWVPLSDDDVTLSEHLQANGYRTAMFCDCPHFLRPGFNYHRGFNEYRFIRGQENDPYVSSRVGIDPLKYLPANTLEVPLERKHGGKNRGLTHFADPLAQYLANTANRGQDESEFFTPQTLGGAMLWLETNQDAEKFLLWIELFDPHEPFDPPQKYYDMYRNPAYKGPKIISPWFHSKAAEDFTKEELEDVRALYAGEVSMVDHWVGKLLKKVDELGLRDDTVIVFVADHGTILGEHGVMSKSSPIKNCFRRKVANIPLIIRCPGGPKGRREKRLVWAPDFMPTCCEMLGVKPPEGVMGRGFWSALQGRGKKLTRDYIVSGGKRDHYVADAQWRYVSKTQGNDEELYERASDPDEAVNLAAQHPDVCALMRQRAEEHFKLGEAS
jgi:arylsulfatase A-like enzyme